MDEDDRETPVLGPPIDADRVPTEIERWLPTDPFDLMRISRALALQACTSRVQALQSENAQLQTSSDVTIRELKAKVTSLQAGLSEASDKLTRAEEEREKLLEEKAALVAMVKKLNRDVAKLETFKRTLMSQLQEEGEEDSSAGMGGGVGATGEASTTLVAGTSSLDSSSDANTKLANAFKKATLADLPEGSGNKAARPTLGTKPAFRTPSMTPSIFSPAYTPSATPPHSASGAASPRVGAKAGRPKVDGKEFFRQARSRLTYEQFSTFLANIKELNAHKQSREETLKKAEEIFGDSNKDLYGQFENLLSRHLPT